MHCSSIEVKLNKLAKRGPTPGRERKIVKKETRNDLKTFKEKNKTAWLSEATRVTKHVHH